MPQKGTKSTKEAENILTPIRGEFPTLVWWPAFLSPEAHLNSRYLTIMIWENTKLLLGLLYRPVSSMGRIVDEGHWLYAAVVVAALSMVFHATVTSVIYNNYEAVYRELPPRNAEHASSPATPEAQRRC